MDSRQLHPCSAALPAIIPINHGEQERPLMASSRRRAAVQQLPLNAFLAFNPCLLLPSDLGSGASGSPLDLCGPLNDWQLSLWRAGHTKQALGLHLPSNLESPA